MFLDNTRSGLLCFSLSLCCFSCLFLTAPSGGRQTQRFTTESAGDRGFGLISVQSNTAISIRSQHSVNGLVDRRRDRFFLRHCDEIALQAVQFERAALFQIAMHG